MSFFDVVILVVVVCVILYFAKPDLFSKLKERISKPKEVPPTIIDLIEPEETKPAPDLGTTAPETGTPVAKPIDDPVSKPAPDIRQKPVVEDTAPEVSITERLFGLSPEVRAYKERINAEYLATKPADHFAQFPTHIPNFLLGEVKQSGYTQSIVTIGPAATVFTLAVPENYNKTLHIYLSPFPGDSNGDAECVFIVRGDSTYKGVKRLDQTNVTITGDKAKRADLYVTRGTYTVEVRASKDCKTLFAVSES